MKYGWRTILGYCRIFLAYFWQSWFANIPIVFVVRNINRHGIATAATQLIVGAVEALAGVAGYVSLRHACLASPRLLCDGHTNSSSILSPFLSALNRACKRTSSIAGLHAQSRLVADSELTVRRPGNAIECELMHAHSRARRHPLRYVRVILCVALRIGAPYCSSNWSTADFKCAEHHSVIPHVQ